MHPNVIGWREPAYQADPAREELAQGLVYERAGALPKAEVRYEGALALATDAEARLRGQLGLARLHCQRSQWAEALALAERVAEDAQVAGECDLAAQAVNVQLAVCEFRGDFDRAEALGARALELATTARTRGAVAQNLGAIASQRRDFDRAREWFAESVRQFATAGYALGLAIAVNNEAASARDQGRLEESERLAERAAHLAREEAALDVLAVAIENRAHALLLLGREAEATDCLAGVLGFFSQAGDELRVAECLEIFGAMYTESDPELAHRFWRRALALATRISAAPLTARLVARLGDAWRPGESPPA